MEGGRIKWREAARKEEAVGGRGGIREAGKIEGMKEMNDTMVPLPSRP